MIRDGPPHHLWVDALECELGAAAAQQRVARLIVAWGEICDGACGNLKQVLCGAHALENAAAPLPTARLQVAVTNRHTIWSCLRASAHGL